MNKAVFIDRDGVINAHKYYPDFGEWESPRTPADFKVYPDVPRALCVLKNAGFYVFIVTNQPSFAKGKTTLENLRAVEKLLLSGECGSFIDRYYSCFHHPDGIVPGYAVNCRCRKPGTLFPEMAIQEFSLTSEQCYFIGDQDSDILCGSAMSFKTVKIENPQSANKSGKITPDYYADDLLQAALTTIERRM